MNKFLTLIILVLVVFLFMQVSKNSNIVAENQYLTQNLVNLAQVKQQVQVVTEKVYVDKKQELNSQNLLEDSPCIELKNTEQFTDQFGSTETINWNEMTWITTRLEDYHKDDKTGIQTCFDAFFTWNDKEYRVNRHHRFMRLSN